MQCLMTRKNYENKKILGLRPALDKLKTIVLNAEAKQSFISIMMPNNYEFKKAKILTYEVTYEVHLQIFRQVLVDFLPIKVPIAQFKIRRESTDPDDNFWHCTLKN